jgi:hypothetical protein
MRKFVLSAVAMTTFAALVSIPAQADTVTGPIRQGNQCFKTSIGSSKDLVGYWTACPQEASATVTPRTTRNARRRASR